MGRFFAWNLIFSVCVGQVSASDAHLKGEDFIVEGGVVVPLPEPEDPSVSEE